MSTYLLLRTLKTLALLALTAGVAVAITDGDAARRRAAVDRVAMPSLLAVWTLGYALSKVTARSLGSPAIGVAMVASLLALLLLDRGSTARWPRAALAGILVGTTVAMHLRDAGAVLGAAAAATVAATLALAPALPALPPAPPDAAGALRRFRAFALFETLTTAALFLVDMPARHGLGVALDGGLGLFGWVHGAAVLGYLTLTFSHHQDLGGTASGTALRALAGVVPFASLWVLHRTAPNATSTAS